MWKCRPDSPWSPQSAPTPLYTCHYYTFIPLEENVTWSKLVSGDQFWIEYHEIDSFTVDSDGQILRDNVIILYRAIHGSLTIAFEMSFSYCTDIVLGYFQS